MAVDITVGSGGTAPPHPNLAFQTVNPTGLGGRIEVPLGPQEVTVDGIAPRWVEIERDGRKPLLINAGGQLRKLSMTLDVAYPSLDPIDRVLVALDDLAKSGVAVSVLYGTADVGPWQIVSVTRRVTERQNGTNAALQATVDVALTERSVADIKIGLVTGPVTADPPAVPINPATGLPTTVSSRAATHPTTQSGPSALPADGGVIGRLVGTGIGRNPIDRQVQWGGSETFQQFTQRTTGDASNWKALFDYNAANNPVFAANRAVILKGLSAPTPSTFVLMVTIPGKYPRPAGPPVPAKTRVYAGLPLLFG